MLGLKAIALQNMSPAPLPHNEWAGIGIYDCLISFVPSIVTLADENPEHSTRMGQKHICHRSSELRAEIRKVRSIEPEAYRLALRARESIRLDQFNREQDITIGNYTYTIPYARQTACCEHHLKIGSPLVVISTNDYWDLFEKISRSPAQMLRNALRNSNETVFVAAEAVELECGCVPFLFVCKESNVEKVRQRVVPLSDALGFEGAIAHAVDVTCSKCGARTPWHNSVFCHLCQATVWCSTRCKEQDITDHETACKEEIECAERILHSSQSTTYWPFVLGLSGFPQNVLPRSKFQMRHSTPITTKPAFTEPVHP